MARQHVTFRLPPELIEAGRDWADEAGVPLTRLVEDGLRERLGIAPLSVDYKLAALGSRVAILEQLVERQEAN
jgi:hypothetical protein